MSHHTTIPLCAQCFFFSGRFFENFRAIGLDTEHESFFLGRQPRACGRASKRETKKKAPPKGHWMHDKENIHHKETLPKHALTRTSLIFD